MISVTPPAENLQNFFGVFLQFQIGVDNGPKEPTVAELEQQARSGQPISLMDYAAAVQREQREQKKSVVEKLKNQPKQEQKRTARKKSAERDR